MLFGEHLIVWELEVSELMKGTRKGFLGIKNYAGISNNETEGKNFDFVISVRNRMKPSKPRLFCEMIRDRI